MSDQRKRGAIEAPVAQRRSQVSGCERPAIEGLTQ